MIGVEEHQRGVEAKQHHARNRLGSTVAINRVQTGEPLLLTEQFHTRARRVFHKANDGQGHGHKNAIDRTEGHNASCGDQRQAELTPVHAPELAQADDVQQRHSCGDQHDTEGSHGHELERSCEQHQHQGDRGGRDQPRDLGFATGGDRHRSAGVSTGDHKTLGQRGGHVGGAIGHQFPVHIHVIPPA